MADWRDYPEFQMFEKQITSWKFEFLLCPNVPDVVKNYLKAVFTQV